MWGLTLDCYDFDCGQPRHFPAGTYNQQRQTAVGVIELEKMRLLWRCWLIFKYTSPDKWDGEDEAFARWVRDEPIDDTRLNEVIRWLWRAHSIM